MEAILREHLERVPLFDPIIRIDASPHRAFISIRTVKDQTIGTTHADLEVYGTTCTLNQIERHKCDARKGYGRKFYEAIERFCETIGVEEIKLHAYGKRKDYWQSLGFIPQSGAFVKRLASASTISE